MHSLSYVSKIVWGPALLLLVLGTGAFLTVSTGFFPLRKIGFIIKNTFGRMRNKSAFAAAATALGATVGTGNIIGVAAAIALGGPGAVFWMWCGAFLGMMLKFAEAALAVRYKGSAAVYIEKAFGGKTLSVIWCACCILASFGGGNMIQTNAAGTIWKDTFGVPPIAIGAAVALLTAAVLFRGAKAVVNISSLLVPFMAVLYVFGCIGVLFVFRQNIIPAFKSIVFSAFEPFALGGGITGIFVSDALRTGISKGTFTHEAGMGSASAAHAESKEKNPVVQGCWGIVEVFADTILVCTITALVILSSKENSCEGAFHFAYGFFGDVFLCISMFLFALAAVIGWAFYGEKAIGYITQNPFVKNIYRAVFCFAAVIGSFAKLPFVWCITDIFNGLMIFPNLAAIIALSPEVLKIAKENPAR